MGMFGFLRKEEAPPTGSRRPPRFFVDLARKSRPTNKTPEFPEFVHLYDVRTLALCEAAYLKEPLTRKGIFKRAHDTLERWFFIDTEDERVLDIVKDLEERTELKSRLIGLLQNAMIYGPAYLEIVFENDENPPDEEPPAEHIARLELIDPKTIQPWYQDDPRKERYGELIGFIQKIPGEVEPLIIHPDRIIYFMYDVIGDGRRAVGVIEPMLHVVNAKIALDKAAGNIPKKVISQIIAATIEGADDATLDEWAEALEEMSEVGRFIGSETFDIKVFDAGRPLDISSYSDHLIKQIAGGVGVPFTVLLGAGAGTLSTSETNLRDYYSDLRDLQVRFTPIIRRLIDIELAAEGITGAEYEIVWNEIYADEQSEAEILSKKARAVDTLIAAGVITTEEARELLGLPERVDGNMRATFGPPLKGVRYAER